jgi:hypothetical protein
MNDTNTGGPAFPTARVNINGVDEQDGIQAFGAGMTLRDYFAAKALQGYMVGLKPAQDIGPGMQDRIAEGMYSMADAMLKAREA